AGRSGQRHGDDLPDPAPDAGFRQQRLDDRYGARRRRAQGPAGVPARHLWRTQRGRALGASGRGVRGESMWGSGMSHTSNPATRTALRSQPLKRVFKLTYCSGALAHGIVVAGFGFFLLFFLTAVCGMSGTMAGDRKSVV